MCENWKIIRRKMVSFQFFSIDQGNDRMEACIIMEFCLRRAHLSGIFRSRNKGADIPLPKR